VERQAPDGGITTTVYDPSGRPWATVDPLGYRTTTEYDQASRVRETINALGQRTTFEYDEAGFRTATVDALGNRTTTLFDAAGRPEATLDALGRLTTTVYDPTGAVLARVNALGRRTSTVYDSAGRVLRTIDALGAIRTTLYDGFGRPEATVDARGFPTTTVYDSYGRAVATQDALGYRFTRLFDAFGRECGHLDQEGYQQTTGFDLLNQPVTHTNALGYRTTTVFDALGRVEARVNELGRRATTVFDATGRTGAQVNELGYRTTMEYNRRGDRTTLTNARGYHRTALFDELGRQYVSVDALGRRTTLAFDPRGAVVTVTDGRGQIETRSYDQLARHKTSEYADNTRLTITYNEIGEVTEQANSVGTWVTGYDEVGRRQTESGPGYPHGHPLTSLYDAAGNRRELHTWRGIQTWTYDARNRTRTLVDIEGGTTTWTHEGRGLITRQDFPNQGVMTALYDGNGRSLQITHSPTARAYASYDPAGNVVNLTRPNLATFSYDAANQLLTEEHSTRGLTTWAFDPVGNRTSAITSTTWATCTYDDADQLINEAKALPYQGQFIPWATSATFSYDGNGNRQTEDLGERFDWGWRTLRHTYVWDPTNHLTQVVHASFFGTNQTNSYRPDGLRHQKVQGVTTRVHLWDGNDLLARVDQAGGLQDFYGRGPNLVKVRYQSGFYPNQYAHLDQQGTVIRWSESTGAAITGLGALDPDPWGGSPSFFAPVEWLGGPGYWLESDLRRDLYYVRARWYVAGGPGWLSPDPLQFRGKQLDLYRYVENRPMVLTDPAGLQSPNETQLALAAAVQDPVEMRCNTVSWLLGQINKNPCKCPNPQLPDPHLAVCLFWQESNLGVTGRVRGNFGTLTDDALTQLDTWGCNPNHLRRNPNEPGEQDFAKADPIEMLELAYYYLGCVGITAYGPDYRPGRNVRGGRDLASRIQCCVDCLKNPVIRIKEANPCHFCLNMVHR
jgi:RHS repeat-associated protein